jgi:hypothetical protein
MQRTTFKFNGKMAHACFNSESGQHLRDPITDEIIAFWSESQLKYTPNPSIHQSQESANAETSVESIVDSGDLEIPETEISHWSPFRKAK